MRAKRGVILNDAFADSTTCNDCGHHISMNTVLMDPQRGPRSILGRHRCDARYMQCNPLWPIRHNSSERFPRFCIDVEKMIATCSRISARRGRMGAWRSGRADQDLSME